MSGTRRYTEKTRVDRVERLKEKARQDNNKVAPSGKTIQDVWYGPQTDNQRAAGTGEYDV